MKYKSKPKVIEAVKWDGSNDAFIDILNMGCAFTRGLAETLKIHTLEGVSIASLGDFIIKGIREEFYPCKPEIFHASYEAIQE